MPPVRSMRTAATCRRKTIGVSEPFSEPSTSSSFSASVCLGDPCCGGDSAFSESTHYETQAHKSVPQRTGCVKSRSRGWLIRWEGARTLEGGYRRWRVWGTLCSQAPKVRFGGRNAHRPQELPSFPAPPLPGCNWLALAGRNRLPTAGCAESAEKCACVAWYRGGH